jgi:hypothetical protein
MEELNEHSSFGKVFKLLFLVEMKNSSEELFSINDC